LTSVPKRDEIAGKWECYMTKGFTIWVLQSRKMRRVGYIAGNKN
jgi:hypothetical protein